MHFCAVIYTSFNRIYSSRLYSDKNRWTNDWTAQHFGVLSLSRALIKLRLHQLGLTLTLDGSRPWSWLPTNVGHCVETELYGQQRRANERVVFLFCCSSSSTVGWDSWTPVQACVSASSCLNQCLRRLRQVDQFEVGLYVIAVVSDTTQQLNLQLA